MAEQKSTLIVAIDGTQATQGARKVTKATDGIVGSVSNVDKKMLSMRNAVKGAFAFGAAIVAIRGISSALNIFAMAAAEQEDRIAQLNAGLISTNGISGQTVGSIRAISSQMQQMTRYSNEAVEEIAGIGLSFTNITGDVFPEFLRISADVATRMGTDLKSTAVQLAKALNDPVANLGALSRAGIQFSKAQKEVITNLWETGRMAEAQGVIIGELNRQYKGSATAAKNTLGGAMDSLRNATDDLNKAIGNVLAPTLRKFIRDMEETAVGLTVWLKLLDGTAEEEKKVEAMDLLAKEFIKVFKAGEKASGLIVTGPTIDTSVSVKDIEQLNAAFFEQREALQNQIAMFGMTSSEIEIFKSQQKAAAVTTAFLDKALKDGTISRAKYAEMAMIAGKAEQFHMDEMKKLLKELADLEGETKKAILSQEDFASVMSNNFADAITGAKSFSDALKDIANQLIRMAVQRAIFNAMMPAAGGTGSATGNAFLPSARMAAGGGAGFIPGPTTSRVGERGAEVVMPLVRNDRGMLGVGGGDSGGGDVIMQFIGDSTDFKRELLTNDKLAFQMNQRMKAGYAFA